MKYKETPVQNITFISLMAGINIILCLIFRFVPFSSLILVLILPFISTLVIIFCKTRYVIIYAISTAILTFLVSAPNSLFYILTPMLSGFAFGFCYKRKLASCFAVIIATAFTLIMYFITMPIIEFVLKLSVYDSFQKLFNLTQAQVQWFFPSFIILTSVCQNIISYIIVSNDLGKYIEITHTPTPYNILALISLSLNLVSLGLVFLYFPLAMAIMVIGLLVSFYSFKRIALNKKYWFYLVIGLLFIFTFAMLYNVVPEPYGLGFISLLGIYSSIISLTMWKSIPQE